MRLCPVFILLSPTDWRFLETAGIFSIFQNVNCPHWCQLSCGNKPSNTHLKDFVGGRSCSDSTCRARNESNTPRLRTHLSALVFMTLQDTFLLCQLDTTQESVRTPNVQFCSGPRPEKGQAREQADAVLNWNGVLMRGHGAGRGGVSGSHMWGLY